jgi:hypothetical protein
VIPAASDELDLRAAGWKKMPIAAEIAFFFLTILAVAALYWLLDELHLEKGWLVLGASIAIAEWLIRRQRFWRTGVEAGLWIGGLFAFIFSLPSSGRPEALLTFVAAFAVAGWRLRNPLFGVIACYWALRYLSAKDLDGLALLGGIVIGLAGAIATARPWGRRSTELLFALMAAGGPLAGYAVYSDARFGSLAGIVVLLLATGAIELAIGIRIRMRAPLIGGAVCVALAAYEARELLRLDDEWKLIAAGTASLVIASLLMRSLRARTTGIVVTPTTAHELQDLAQAAAVMPMATPEAAAAQKPVSGGGEFGGAGATGEF